MKQGKSKLWMAGIALGAVMILFTILAGFFHWAKEPWFLIVICIFLAAFLYLRVAYKLSEERKKK
ncbi:hypothetical protein [Metabacillus sp. RGM 3146]|uniref:hypothetical protein n=1 Tax=Metabacillus sp. RGM 3146 TaxID=3401092 RepID=UPI003B9AA0C0